MKRITIIIPLIFLYLPLGARECVTIGKPSEGLSSPMIQKAMDEVSRKGGGTVRLKKGVYRCGTLYLRDGVELRLDKGATVLGSDKGEDYPFCSWADSSRVVYISSRSLFIADGVSDVAITGKGTIDGNGWDPYFQQFGNNEGHRPHAILLKDSRNVRVSDINIRNAAFWTVRLFRSDTVTISGVTIRSLCCFNNDGIDVDARNVLIEGCDIECDDDGICLKSDDPDFLPQNIRVRNCTIASNCNPIKLGTASICGFKDVWFDHITIKATSESNVWDWSTRYREVAPGTKTGLSGIAVECVDGGNVENINFNDIVMESGVITPIFACINRRHGAGTMQGIHFRNIKARTIGIIPCLLSAIPGSYIKDVSIENVFVECEGRGTKEDAETILKENYTGYPENRMYGRTNPASGLYLRHIDGISVNNFEVSFRNPDERPLLVTEDVKNLITNNIITK